MENKKQTAIQWLYDQLVDTPKDKFNWYTLLQKAKELEKEQINKAFYDGYYQEESYDPRSGGCYVVDYYNDTYNKTTKSTNMENKLKSPNLNKSTTMVKYKFNPGDNVWAISRWHKDGKPTDHLAIYPAVIESVTLYKDNKREYWLQTPDGKSWGDVIDQEIFGSFEEAIAFVKLEWEKYCNTF